MDECGTCTGRKLYEACRPAVRELALAAWFQGFIHVSTPSRLMLAISDVLFSSLTISRKQGISANENSTNSTVNLTANLTSSLTHRIINASDLNASDSFHGSNRSHNTNVSSTAKNAPGADDSIPVNPAAAANASKSEQAFFSVRTTGLSQVIMGSLQFPEFVDGFRVVYRPTTTGGENTRRRVLQAMQMASPNASIS